MRFEMTRPAASMSKRPRMSAATFRPLDSLRSQRRLSFAYLTRQSYRVPTAKVKGPA
jgi:hypothetical protein